MEKAGHHTPMGRHIGIDFGRNVTVLAASHGSGGPATLVPFSRISRDVPGPGGCEPVPVIPSAIHFYPDGSFSVGEEATSPALAGSQATFQRLVYYLCENSPALGQWGRGRRSDTPKRGQVFSLNS